MENSQNTFKALRKNIIDGQDYRASISGNAIIPEDMNIPKCRLCGKELMLFLQFDVEEKFSLIFASGSHFVLFMCPNCNEIPTFERYEDGLLPEDFWDKTEGHFFASLHRPGKNEIVIKQLPYLQHFRLDFVPIDSQPYPCDTIRIGGLPYWLQFPEQYTCPCGAPMKFLCQIPENFGFPKCLEAPEQPDSFSEDEYCLFLGNEIYVFACAKQCNDRAVWITVQG
jgi:hypothetical protein